MKKYIRLSILTTFVFCLIVTISGCKRKTESLNSNEKENESSYREDIETTSNSNRATPLSEPTSTTFHSDSDVIAYLSSNSFTHNGVSISVSGGNMYLNGQCVSGAISVVNFNSTRAQLEAHSPYSGRMRFVVDCRNETITDLNSGDVFRK